MKRFLFLALCVFILAFPLTAGAADTITKTDADDAFNRATATSVQASADLTTAWQSVNWGSAEWFQLRLDISGDILLTPAEQDELLHLVDLGVGENNTLANCWDVGITVTSVSLQGRPRSALVG